MKQSVQRFFRRLFALIPTKLPQGRAEFIAWAEDILDLYGLPVNDSTRGALAVMVVHLNAQDGYKAKEYFGRTLIKSAASQIAHAYFVEMKTKFEAQAKLDAEEAAKKEAAEKTPNNVVTLSQPQGPTTPNAS